jgi:hypothetical protein
MRLRQRRRAIVLLVIGFGGMLISAFTNIPSGACYVIAGALFGVEGMAMLEDG